jgi:hypothetical protein
MTGVGRWVQAGLLTSAAEQKLFSDVEASAWDIA